MNGGAPTAAADSQVAVLALALIRRLAACFPRDYIDPARVDEFAQLFADDGLDALPPLTVVPDGEGEFFLADGFHRADALEQLGLDSAQVVVVQPPPGRAPIDFAYEVGLRQQSR